MPGEMLVGGACDVFIREGPAGPLLGGVGSGWLERLSDLQQDPAASLGTLSASNSPGIHTEHTHVGLCEVGGGVCAPTWEWSGVFFRGTGSGARQTLVLPVPAGKPWANLCTSLGFLFHILKVFPIPWGVFQVMLLSSHKDLFSYLLMHPATSCLRVFARAVPSA